MKEERKGTMAKAKGSSKEKAWVKNKGTNTTQTKVEEIETRQKYVIIMMKMMITTRTTTVHSTLTTPVTLAAPTDTNTHATVPETNKRTHFRKNTYTNKMWSKTKSNITERLKWTIEIKKWRKTKSNNAKRGQNQYWK